MAGNHMTGLYRCAILEVTPPRPQGTIEECRDAKASCRIQITTHSSHITQVVYPQASISSRSSTRAASRKISARLSTVGMWLGHRRAYPCVVAFVLSGAEIDQRAGSGIAVLPLIGNAAVMNYRPNRIRIGIRPGAGEHRDERVRKKRSASIRRQDTAPLGPCPRPVSVVARLRMTRQPTLVGNSTLTTVACLLS